MLAKLGCSYVVVGHSERRAVPRRGRRRWSTPRCGRPTATGSRRSCASASRSRSGEAGGHVEHCTRPARRRRWPGVTAEQAAAIVIAYEPVWAIGTGEVATPDDAQEVCAAIRAQLGELYAAELADGVRILYGGSVKAATPREILAQPDVDGALVGGASLDADEFAGDLCAAARPAGRARRLTPAAPGTASRQRHSTRPRLRHRSMILTLSDRARSSRACC